MPISKPERYTVKLHFAQIDDCVPGAAAFDLKLQGETVAAGVDIIDEAGGTGRTVVRQFDNVSVEQNLVIEVVQRGKELPTLAAIEVTKQ